MKIITEKTIDRYINQLETEKSQAESLLKTFSDEQPAFTQFIASENFKLLEESEYDIFLFILTVIYSSWSSQNEDVPIIDAELISSIDEENWEVYNEQGGQNYKKALDVFFTNYKQEDLLAFVEDTLVEDEDADDSISTVGRELIFITAKTLIDTLALSQ
jgi:hypothetical protein